MAPIAEPWSRRQIETETTKRKFVKPKISGRANPGFLSGRLLGAA
jgi:hypothetical protein